MWTTTLGQTVLEIIWKRQERDTQPLCVRKKKLNLPPGRSIVDSMLEASCSNKNLFPRKRSENVSRSEQYSVHNSSSDERFVSSDERPSDEEDDNGVDNTQRQVTKESLQPVNVTMDQLIEDQTFIVIKLMYNVNTKKEVAKYFIARCKEKKQETVMVHCLRRSAKNMNIYTIPDGHFVLVDVIEIQINQIIKTVMPDNISRGRHFFKNILP
ncbi:hypothetical protein ILUMI_01259 [Ignelater luminosus]|uniref:Uncharacterized protein n=1 Tax=Ignelater luminosus TaxID=2038154 RepID=A0A8K0GKF4_IGNLU|nr:hypothetical protein ILUMI_01259 [Ignelater luminosus]